MKYAFDRRIGIANPDGAWVGIGYGDIIKNVTVVDKYTVQFNLNIPFAAFLSLMACQAAFIVDPARALITHDLSIVLERSDKIIVMYAGRIVERAPSSTLYAQTQHPYSQGLLKSIPNIELAEQKLTAIGGSPPDLLHPPIGCRFWPRCPYIMEICKIKEPPLFETGVDHLVRCYLYRGEKAS